MDEPTMYKASAHRVSVAPRKARLVMDMIRGRNVVQALGILESTPKKASPILRTLLKSAIANAEQAGGEVEVDSLKVQRGFVDMGPTLKRYRPRAMGRATPIRKRTSHITLYVG